MTRYLTLEDGQVTFRYQDYAEDRRAKHMTLAADEFLRRFLQRVLPSGFVKIRHYGLLANRSRQANLQVCRALLWVVATVAVVTQTLGNPGPAACQACPQCGGTVWQVRARVPRPTVAELCALPLPTVPAPDSS